MDNIDKYLSKVDNLEHAGYLVGQNTDGTFYWSTYSSYKEGFSTEEEAWNDAEKDYD